MRFRKWFMASLVVLLVMPVATATVANAEDDTATQYVQVTVWAPGLLTIDVENQFGVGGAIPGGTAGPHWFWMGIMNTTSPASGWQVTVTGTDLIDGWIACDESGNNCEIQSDDGINATIPMTNITVAGGNWQWWDGANPNPITDYSGTLGLAPLQIMTGTADAWGGLSFDNPNPSVTVAVPNDALVTDYAAELTYTISAWTPPVP